MGVGGTNKNVCLSALMVPGATGNAPLAPPNEGRPPPLHTQAATHGEDGVRHGTKLPGAHELPTPAHDDTHARVTSDHSAPLPLCECSKPDCCSRGFPPPSSRAPCQPPPSAPDFLGAVSSWFGARWDAIAGSLAALTHQPHPSVEPSTISTDPTSVQQISLLVDDSKHETPDQVGSKPPGRSGNDVGAPPTIGISNSVNSDRPTSLSSSATPVVSDESAPLVDTYRPSTFKVPRATVKRAAEIASQRDALVARIVTALAADGGQKLTQSLMDELILAHPDSGCTASLTWNAKWLVNLRDCDETFVQANGRGASSKQMGDMPVIGRDKDGKLRRFTIRNVRLVPDFKYTLLSVDQMWSEQRLDAVFGATRALRLPSGSKLPFVAERRLRQQAEALQ